MVMARCGYFGEPCWRAVISERERLSVEWSGHRSVIHLLVKPLANIPAIWRWFRSVGGEGKRYVCSINSFQPSAHTSDKLSADGFSWMDITGRAGGAGFGSYTDEVCQIVN
jgi:hypothetical protein